LDRTLLFLAYFFPPRGGAGVQRSIKFAKYLPQFGWKPLVIAHGGMADNASGVMDPSLLKDLPDDHIVRYTALMQGEKDSYYRAQKKWRQPMFATDPMAWWAAPAARMGMELAGEHHPSAIFVTMSPFTAAGAGIELKKKTGLPLILDLRDPWALDETRIYTTRWHARRDWKQMLEALAAADLIMMNTPEAAAAVRDEFGEGRAVDSVGPRIAGRVISITNGFDAEDFGRNAPQFAAPDALRIVHTGMFHSELAEVWDKVFTGDGLLNRLKYPRRPINLWTRTPRYLLAAMEQIVKSGAVPKEKLELVLVGEISHRDQAMIDASPMASNVKVLGYRSHAESVNWVESADVLFLPLHTPTDGGPALVVPGKTYEYLGSGRPILAMGPPGDMRNFVEQTGSGIAVAGDDVAGAAAALVNLYEAKKSGRKMFKQDREVIAQFERKALTARLAEELNQLTRQSKAVVCSES
jgi:glycosyltransferase involved in cell wall biosynthesis